MFLRSRTGDPVARPQLSMSWNAVPLSTVQLSVAVPNASLTGRHLRGKSRSLVKPLGVPGPPESTTGNLATHTRVWGSS